MTAAAVARTVGGVVAGAPDVVVTGAEVDSRRLREGELFVALAGEHADGHRFVAAALETAAAALVRSDRDVAPPPPGRALIGVPDPLTAYHELAAADRARRSWRVAALTGSVGKTTTKEMLGVLLGERFRVGVSEGNRNSTLGLPAQLLRQPEEVELFVAELGMSRAGELDTLGRITRPDLVLYTRLAAAHTEFFPDMTALVEAKAELLPHLDAAGVLVLNADDPYQDGYAARCRARVSTYGGPESPVRLEHLLDRGLAGTRFELVASGERAEVELPLAGRHQAENLLAAAAAATQLGVTAAEVAAAAGGLRAAPHRGRVYRLAAGITVVDDSYNASPSAVRALLGLLAGTPGRRVAVLGEMYELGAFAEEAHARAGREAAAAADLLIAVGAADAGTLAAAARMAGLAERFVYLAADAGEAAELLGRILEPGDVVLVKGSRGVGLELAVAALVGEEAA